MIDKRKRLLKRLYKEYSSKIEERDQILWCKDRQQTIMSLIEQDDLEINKIGLNLINKYCKIKSKALRKERLCKQFTMN